jgi:hypothetical protein
MFGACLIFGLLILLAFLKESKGKTKDEIEKLYNENVESNH